MSTRADQWRQRSRTGPGRLMPPTGTTLLREEGRQGSGGDTHGSLMSSAKESRDVSPGYRSSAHTDLTSFHALHIFPPQGIWPAHPKGVSSRRRGGYRLPVQDNQGFIDRPFVRFLFPMPVIEELRRVIHVILHNGKGQGTWKSGN